MYWDREHYGRSLFWRGKSNSFVLPLLSLRWRSDMQMSYQTGSGVCTSRTPEEIRWRGAESATPKCTTLAGGLFWAEGSQDPADLRKTFTSPLTALKNLGRRPGAERELLPEITFYLKDLPAWQSKYLITKHLLCSCELPSSSLKPQASVPFLSSGWPLGLILFMGLLYVQNQFCFSLVSLFYVNLIIKTPKD